MGSWSRRTIGRCCLYRYTCSILAHSLFIRLFPAWLILNRITTRANQRNSQLTMYRWNRCSRARGCSVWCNTDITHDKKNVLIFHDINIVSMSPYVHTRMLASNRHHIYISPTWQSVVIVYNSYHYRRLFTGTSWRKMVRKGSRRTTGHRYMYWYTLAFL